MMVIICLFDFQIMIDSNNESNTNANSRYKCSANTDNSLVKFSESIQNKNSKNNKNLEFKE